MAHEAAQEPDGAATVVGLGGRLTQARAGGIRAALRAALAEGKPVAIRFDAVGEADLTLLQLLCAAHRTAALRGQEMTVTGAVPDAIAALAERAGAEACAGGPPGCIVGGLARRGGR